MTYLSEDPTLLVTILLLVAGAFLVALNVSQQGKYLISAGVTLGLVVLVVVTEWIWVTDNERIEHVVYSLRQAVLNSDAQGVLSHLAPNVQYLQGDIALSEDATRALVETNLSRTRLDFVRISDLQISAGQQSRRGKAEFRVFTRGTLNSGLEGGTAVSAWSLGFEETASGIWKVNRISPLSVPIGILAIPTGTPPFDESEPVVRNSSHERGTGRKGGIGRRLGTHQHTLPRVTGSAPDSP